MKKFMKVMKALSDKNRLKIIKMLQHKEMLCVCEIQSGLGLAQSTVSKHLKLLEDAELVIYEKDGLWVNHSLNYKPDNPYSATMLGNLRCWLEGEHEIVELKKKLPGLDRAYICN
ncbi:MAG: transcriptional regulator [Deltaproteobacteria bacterium]|nr:MAG: transcriptional regulator [Deltaproteobacteria bacterium]